MQRDDLIDSSVTVLDRGWVELQDQMGDGLAIINAAQVSFLGVAREMARLFLPGFAVYYTWIVKVDALNLMHFLRLRLAPEAQYEIRAYAETLYEHFFKPALPWTAEAFETYWLGNSTTS